MLLNRCIFILENCSKKSALKPFKPKLVKKPQVAPVAEPVQKRVEPDKPVEKVRAKLSPPLTPIPRDQRFKPQKAKPIEKPVVTEPKKKPESKLFPRLRCKNIDLETIV